MRRRKRDREFSVELESHLDMHVADNMRAGMTPKEARRQAAVQSISSWPLLCWAVSAIACLLPALRALRVSLVVALRYE